MSQKRLFALINQLHRRVYIGDTSKVGADISSALRSKSLNRRFKCESLEYDIDKFGIKSFKVIPLSTIHHLKLNEEYNKYFKLFENKNLIYNFASIEDLKKGYISISVESINPETGMIKEYNSISQAVNEGFHGSSIRAAADSGRVYSGLLWNRVRPFKQV